MARSEFGNARAYIALFSHRIFPSVTFRFFGVAHRSRERLRGLIAAFKTWPPVGLVRFGSFRRLRPIATHHGAFRGTPIDRYYIERFLEQHSADVQGDVLEVGDRIYTRRFGAGHIVQSNVLHIEPGHPDATIVADLSTGDGIETGAFDCIICTQTIQCIYDIRSAVRTLHRILKPGGVLLATTHGIGQLDCLALGTWGEYWRLTSRSAKTLFGEFFGSTNVEVQAHGNVLTSIALLHGLTVAELTPKEFDYHDPVYEMLITIRAVKAASTTP